MTRTLAAVAGLAFVAGSAQGAFVQGASGFYSESATLSTGESVTVHQMFLAWDDPADELLNIFDANLSTVSGNDLYQFDGFGGGDTPDAIDPGGEDTVLDSWVTVGNTIGGSTTTSLDPDFGFTPTGVEGGWFTSNPPMDEGIARAPGASDNNGNMVIPSDLDDSFFYTLAGQFTEIGSAGLEGDATFTPFSPDQDIFEGIISLGMQNDNGPTTKIFEIDVQVPTPGAMALFGLAGLTAVRRRRK